MKSPENRPALRILLVEDSEHDRFAFRRALKKSELPSSITELNRAEEAQDKIRGHPSSFNLVVVDHKLPGLSGLELCKELIKHGTTFPLVLITGVGDEHLAVEALKAGVDDYIVKDSGQTYLSILPLVLKNIVQKHGERLARKQAEQGLQRRFRIEKALASISANFIGLPHESLESEIDQALKIMGGISEADRSHIFLFRENNMLMYNTLEWCADGIKPAIKRIRALSGDSFPWSMERINRLEIIQVPRVEDLPPEAEAEKKSLEAQDVKSYINLPLISGAVPIGIIGFEAVRQERTWEAEDIALLKMAGEIITQAIVRDRAERTLQESELEYRTLFETMAQGVVCHNAEGHIVSANPAAEKILGLSPEQVQGEAPVDPFSGAIHEDGSFFSEETYPFRLALNTGEAVKDVLMGIFSTIEEDARWILINCVPQFREVEDRPFHIFSTFQDVTSLRRLQAQLIRSGRLASAGQLAASIAHEINSPLQAITLMLDELTGKNSDNRELVLGFNLLKEAYGNIRNTVVKLLDLNRPGKDQIQPIDINQVIQETAALLASYLKRSKTKITMKLSCRISPVRSSHQQLGQVFMNLINNSVEAMSAPDHPDTNCRQQAHRDREITISTILKKGTVVATVSDTGPGIPPKDLESIFDPFFTSKKKMGMGVGLSVCHRIIENFSGALEARNLPEGGAAFNIKLPVYKISIQEESK